jgi:hypothetical protein
VFAEVPRVLAQAERTALALADMARGGLRLDDVTVERLAAAQAHANRWTRRAVWVGALALAAIAVWLMAGGLGPLTDGQLPIECPHERNSQGAAGRDRGLPRPV